MDDIEIYLEKFISLMEECSIGMGSICTQGIGPAEKEPLLCLELN